MDLKWSTKIYSANGNPYYILYTDDMGEYRSLFFQVYKQNKDEMRARGFALFKDENWKLYYFPMRADRAEELFAENTTWLKYMMFA